MDSHNNTECQSIELSDDDEECKKRPKRSRKPTDCLNVECEFGEEYLDSVPAFVLTYYKVRRHNGLKVCMKCFDEAVSYFEELKNKYDNQESIYDFPSSQYKPVLNIDDSDEEDLSPDDGEVPLDEETIDMIEKEFPSLLRDVMNHPNTRFQIDDSCKKLKADADKLMEEYKGIEKTTTNIQKEIDDIKRQIYVEFKPIIQTVPAIEIIDVLPSPKQFPTHIYRGETYQTLRTVAFKRNSYMSNQMSPNQGNSSYFDSNQDVVEVSSEILEVPQSLPPQNIPFSRPRLRINDSVYVMKHSCKYHWKCGTIVNIVREKGFNEYQVKLSSTNKKSSVLLAGKFLAYHQPSSFRFSVGFRVIAVFKEDRAQKNQTLFYSGTVAEPPKIMNKYRYLIFFDDGCAQYVPHKQIRQICEPSMNPWDDIPIPSRDFTRKYLCEYPERPMVKLQTGNIIKVEYERQWLAAKVMEVDGSLANMLYLVDGRTEWVYRGSLRLEPLFREFTFARRRKETGDRIRRITGKYDANVPYVEYTHNIDGEEEDDESSDNTTSKSRAVAKKSTSKRTKPLKWTPIPVPGTIVFKKVSNITEPKEFTPHQCGPPCINWAPFDPSKMRTIGPLEAPIYFGYRRIISHFGGGKRSVLYKAPCGRSLRNMIEVHRYLKITKSQMTVDLFDFDFWVNCLAEFTVHGPCIVNIPDITEGREKCPIGCVNYLDNVLPDFKCYLAERVPRENVGLNLEPEFLCSCDCTDDCQDREKCSCWQLTIEGQKLIPNNPIDPNVGYHYRRLPERVVTGIYECNKQCKCSKVTCLNRVVQYPLKQKLQLYKTQMKGWGLRCLTDIPQGAFICVYAGHLLTDQEANEEGKNYGDEYLAELDYIEVIEGIKYGYESDVPEDMEEDLKEVRAEAEAEANEQQQNSPASSPETSETVNAEADAAETAETAEARESNSIKSRLRERKTKQTASQSSEEKEKTEKKKRRFSIRKYYTGTDEVFIMDAKCSGNIGRFLNHSCMPNVFVQNVFVDTHDIRFPWVAFFAQIYIKAGSELTWDYNYDIGSVEGKVKYCYCNTEKCRKRLL